MNTDYSDYLEEESEEPSSEENEIVDRKKIITKMTNYIMDYAELHETEIQEMHETISEKDKIIKQLTEQVEQKDKEINGYKTELAKIRAENDSKIKEIKAKAGVTNSELMSKNIEQLLIIGYYEERYKESNKCLDNRISMVRRLIDGYMTFTKNLTSVTGSGLSEFITKTFDRDTVAEIAYSYLSTSLDEHCSGTLKESKNRIHSIVYKLILYLDDEIEEEDFDDELDIILEYFAYIPEQSKSDKTPHTLFITEDLGEIYKYSIAYTCDQKIKELMMED